LHCVGEYARRITDANDSPEERTVAMGTAALELNNAFAAAKTKPFGHIETAYGKISDGAREKMITDAMRGRRRGREKEPISREEAEASVAEKLGKEFGGWTRKDRAALAKLVSDSLVALMDMSHADLRKEPFLRG
jgi:hypothetical protein